MAPEAEPRSSSPSDDPRPRKPRKLGKYRIEKKIGAGGMGAVYLATDTDLKRTVALKILPKDKAENPTLVKRFKAEAQSAAQLRHEHIVSVYEAGSIDEQLYIALEYVEGTDVHQLVARRGVLPVRRSIEVVRQIAEALEHAQTQNIVHRDIKPSNLLIRRDGIVKLADLGLARAMDDTAETAITRAGTTVGTVDYMSPEQARDSKAADTRSDIYSLGCTWYHMLTGRPPWPEGSLTSKLHAHATEAPPDPRVHNPAVTDAVVACLHRMMAKNPEDRYQSPRELLQDLSRDTLNRETVSNDVLAGLSEAAAALTDEVPLPQTENSSGRTVADSRLPVDEEFSRSPSTGRRRKRTARNNRDRNTTAAESVREFEDPEADADTPPAHAEPRPTSRRRKRSSRRDESLEDSNPSPRKKSRSGTAGGSGRTSSDEPVPPRPTKPRKQSAFGSDSSGAQSAVREKQVRLDPLKLAAVLLLVGGGIFGLQQISARLADGFGSSGTHQNPFGAEDGELDADGQELAAGEEEGGEGEGDQPGQEKRAPTNRLTRRNPDESDGRKRPGGQSPSGQPAGGSPTVRTGVSGSEADNRIAVDFQPDREGEKPWQPEWLGFVPAQGTLLEEAAAAGMNVIRVGRGPNSREPGDVETIQGGLAGHDGKDRILILQGDGPFELPPATIQNSGLLALVAEPSSSPVIVIRSSAYLPENQPGAGPQSAPAGGTGHFRLTGGTLALLGVHLLSVPGSAGTATAGPLLALTDADLVMRQCSITADDSIDGSTAPPVTAISLSGQRQGQHREPTDRRLRALLDRVTIRGEHLTAIDLQPGTMDLVASNCVFASQTAPLISLEATNEPPISTAAENRRINVASSEPLAVKQEAGEKESSPVQPAGFSTEVPAPLPGSTTAHQVIRLLSCTLVSGSTGMRFLRKADNETGEAEIQCVNSVLASTGDKPSRTLLELVGWTERSSPDPVRSRVEGLEWKSESTALLGWNQLVHSEDQPGQLVEGPSAWRLLWRETGSSLYIGTDRWPGNRLEELAVLQPAALSVSAGSTGTVRATDETLPGCRETELTIPTGESIARGQTAASRPLLSQWLEGRSTASETIPFDLNKANLGDFVSSGRWPDDAVIEATGSGTCRTSPIVIKRGRLTIRFRDTGEKPLVLEPVRMKSPLPTSLIRVESGGLRLEGARINIPRPERGSGSRQGQYPPWVFQLGAADVALQNCSISLPMYDTEELSGIIRWPEDQSELGGRDFSTGRPGRYRNTLLITDSWMTGEGVLLNAHLHRRAIIVRNSVLCPLRDLLQLDISGAEGEPDSAVDIDHSTLATPNTVFQINSITRNRRTVRPLRLFVQSTIFATPPDPGEQIESESISLKFEGNVLEQSQAVWFGSRNGWMLPSIKVLMRGPGMLPVNSPDFTRDWLSRWEAGHALQPLYRSGDVVLANPMGLPHRNSLKPDSYTLAGQCSAAGWSVTGEPIGADVAQLNRQLEGKPSAGKKSQDRKKGKTKLPSAPRKSSTPGF